jgi:hypothetical protein
MYIAPGWFLPDRDWIFIKRDEKSNKIPSSRSGFLNSGIMMPALVTNSI